MYNVYASGISITCPALSTGSLTTFKLTHQTRAPLKIIHTAWAQVGLSATPQESTSNLDRLSSQDQLICLGTPPRLLPPRLFPHSIETGNVIDSAVGDHNGIRLAVLASGTVCSIFRAAPRDGANTDKAETLSSDPNANKTTAVLVSIHTAGTPPLLPGQKIVAIAATNAGRVAVAVCPVTPTHDERSEILEFAALGELDSTEVDEDLHSWLFLAGQAKSLRRHSVAGRVRDMQATRDGFVALTQQGEVYTWAADERRTVLADLGREAGSARAPGLVSCTAGLRVVKISACQGGSCVGVVTEAGDGFVWGPEVHEGLGLPVDTADAGAVRLVLREGSCTERDDFFGTGFADLAVGINHCIVLDQDGVAWVGQGAQWEKTHGTEGQVLAVGANDDSCFVVTRSAEEQPGRISLSMNII